MDGGIPMVSITSPQNNAKAAPVSMTVDGGTVETLPVSFTLTNFTLVAPGTASCANTDNTCGHIHLLVDPATDGGTSVCNAPSSPYNTAIASGTSGNAILSQCPMVTGMHTIVLELHHNDHSPVTVNGQTVSAHVQVNVTADGG